MAKPHDTSVALEERLANLVRDVKNAQGAVQRTVIGQDDVVDQLILAMVSGGHVLLEGAPGLGKTLLVRTIADVFGLTYARIQFTPDLMPADITGANVLLYDEHGHAKSTFERGPVFRQLVLADEINRATPKTQSALLEAMQEKTITAGGVEHALPRPFFVMATQNPVEMEGTYDLPEAQLDRFFLKSVIHYPDDAAMHSIVTQSAASSTTPEATFPSEDLLALQDYARQVHVPEIVSRVVICFARLSQPSYEGAPSRIRRFVRFGISPRGAQYLVTAAKSRALLAGRYNASVDDLEALAIPVLRHRLQLTFEGSAEGIVVDELLADLFERAVTTSKAT